MTTDNASRLNHQDLVTLIHLLNNKLNAGLPVEGSYADLVAALEAFLDANPAVDEHLLAAADSLEEIPEPKMAANMPMLHKAKAYSDRKLYRNKAAILRHMMNSSPDEWMIDTPADKRGIVGLTHMPTGYQFHLPKKFVPPSVSPIRDTDLVDDTDEAEMADPIGADADLLEEGTKEAKAGKFSQPENWDVVETLKDDATLCAGANDWEDHGWTWAAVQTTEGQADSRHKRYWIRINYAKFPEKAMGSIAHSDETKAHGKKAVKLWLEKAKELAKASERSNWFHCLDEAAGSSELSDYVADHGIERTQWQETKAAAAPAPPPITGPEAIAYALSRVNLDKLEEDAKNVIRSKKVSKRPAAVQVLNTITGLRRNKLTPGDLMVKSVPVIPPVFRPFSVAGNTFVAGDANELYQDLFKHRDAYKQTRALLGEAGSSEARLAMYDAVRALYGYGDPVSNKMVSRGVSGFLRQVSGASPKTGVVQRRLLSKPQDSVARGTIIVDPDLELDEIGVPRDMARTAYANYVQRRLVRLGMSASSALEHITNRTEHAERALEAEVRDRPVLYSRAPAWHKFSFLAGKPKLIDGNAIAINPYVTTGLNADFDGDQINLHVPSSSEAVSEAREKLMPSKMLFSPRNPDNTVPQPKQEHILGLYTASHRPATQTHYFPTEAEAVKAINSGAVSLKDNVEIGAAPVV